MELYVEYKPCFKTIRDKNGNIEYGDSFIPLSIIYFKDGKSNCDLFLSKDCKFIYGFYNGDITLFRITNITSKPIKHKYDRISKYKKIQKQIDELKRKQRELIIKK